MPCLHRGICGPRTTAIVLSTRCSGPQACCKQCTGSCSKSTGSFESATAPPPRARAGVLLYLRGDVLTCNAGPELANGATWFQAAFESLCAEQSPLARLTSNLPVHPTGGRYFAGRGGSSNEACSLPDCCPPGLWHSRHPLAASLRGVSRSAETPSTG